MLIIWMNSRMYYGAAGQKKNAAAGIHCRLEYKLSATAALSEGGKY